MATTTTINGFSIPQLSDVPNIETAVNTFANSIDARVIPILATVAARTTAIPSPTAGQVAFVTATGEMYYYNGTAWVGIGPRCKKAGSNTIITDSTTLANITNSNFTVEANSTYIMRGVVIANSTGSVANDIKFGWTYPTSATANWGMQAPVIGVSVESGNGIYTGNLAQTDQPTFGTLTTAQQFQWDSTWNIGANAGTVQLQCAEGAAVGGVTSVGINGDSWISCQKVA